MRIITALSGFTLTEILLILAALLFPPFAIARENNRRAACQSNLKQVGLAVMRYDQEFGWTSSQHLTHISRAFSNCRETNLTMPPTVSTSTRLRRVAVTGCRASTRSVTWSAPLIPTAGNRTKSRLQAGSGYATTTLAKCGCGCGGTRQKRRCGEAPQPDQIAVALPHEINARHSSRSSLSCRVLLAISPLCTVTKNDLNWARLKSPSSRAPKRRPPD